MNNYLVKKINDKLSVNNANYFTNLYKLDQSDSPTKLKYDKIEIVLWLKKLNEIEYSYMTYDKIIKLDMLILSYENIILLPQSISHLTNLEKLYLNCNNITNISSLTNLVNLKLLRLGFNKIEHIPKLCLPNLEILYLDHNPIVDYSGLLQFPNLEKLYIYDTIIVNKLKSILANTIVI